MNFEFSADQKFIQQQAREFLSVKCTTQQVRTVLDGGDALDEALWQDVIKLGWTGTTIPESYGGLGLSHLELCVIAEELGRALAPIPLSSSLYLATEILLMAGSEKQKQSWLPRLAGGDVRATVQVPPGGAGRLYPTVQHKDGTLRSESCVVADAGIADFIIVAAEDEEGIGLFLITTDQEAVVISPTTAIDPTRPLFMVALNDATSERVGGAGDGADILGNCIDRAAVLVAFEQVGGASACLDMGREYTTNRYAFGRPVASFQAIKHKLADMFVAIELARSNAYYGAWALSTDAADLTLAAAAARISAGDAYFACSKENIQAHGGMGFTWEFDCHLYYRRAQHLSLLLGGQRYWKNRLVDQIKLNHAA